MSITSYAQNFEDVMLWRALSHVEHGLYIDVGAQDPVVDSVSLAFHEHGWRGIHIEPTPRYAERLRQHRPGDTVIQAAVVKGATRLPFYEIPETGLSTADPTIAAEHRRRGFEVRKITVRGVALSTIFKSCAGEDIHWLKIDVEGFEKKVLSSWGRSSARPWIVVVESTRPLTQIETHEAWESTLVGYGYTPVYFDGLNRYYVSDAHIELKDAFSAPPNVFDGFVLNGTASAPFHQLIDVRYRERVTELLAQLEQQGEGAICSSESGEGAAPERDRPAAGQEWNAEREQMQQQLAAARESLMEAKSEAAEREKTLSGLMQQTLEKARRESQAHLRELVERERMFAGQLIELQRDAQQAALEQARIHAAREQALQGELSTLHAECDRAREAAAEQARRDLDVLRNDAARVERRLASELAAQSEARQALQFQLAETGHRLEFAQGVEADLRAALSVETERSASMAAEMESMRRTYSWRWTTPMRSVAAWLGSLRKATKPGAPRMDNPLIHDAQPVGGIGHIEQLLELDESAFLPTAYRILLGRTPDGEGLRYYKGRLSGGVSRLQIVWQLCQSREARSHRVNLPGLDAALRAYRWRRFPLLGGLLPRLAVVFGRPERRAGQGLFRPSEPRRRGRLGRLKIAFDRARERVTGHPGIPEEAAQLPSGAREVYLQLKKAAVHAGRAE